MITLIATLDIDNGIGNIEGEPLYKIVKSEENVRNITKGNITVVGRKTFEKLPKNFLDGRKIIVMSKNKDYKPIGVQVANNIDEIIKISLNFDIYVIGGEQIFNEFIKYADKLILTQVYDAHKDAYYYFPEFTYKDWIIKSSDRGINEDGELLPFGFVTYNKITTKEEK